MAIGKCKFFDPVRGFGMLMPDAPNDPDVFIHVTEVKHGGYATLEPGQSVKYEIGLNPKNGREMAIHVELQDPIMSRPFVSEDRFAIADAAFRDQSL